MSDKPRYKIVGGPRAGEPFVPTADGMQRDPAAKPIKASDRSPLAQAARAEQAANPDYELDPVSFEFEQGTITVYAPSASTDDDVLRELGLDAYQRKNRDYLTIFDAVYKYTGGK